MPLLLNSLYISLAVCYLWLDARGEFPLNFLLKIMPLLLLTGWVLRSVSARKNHALLAALACSMLGDVLLAWDGQRLFVFGLGAFLLAHLCYLLAMRPFAGHRPLLLLPYALFAAGVLTLMWPGLGAMAVPVLCYISVILSMSYGTWCSNRRNAWLVGGGLLFISSDCLIGLNRFWQPLPGAGVWIMLSYYAAQYALVRGFLTPKSIAAAQT
jgi:uncharacterized membrane protein YhhN